MIEHNLPRVKLPDVVQRKPVMPGLNSWAQSQQQNQHQQKYQLAYEPSSSVMVTRRDKYEHKPMPAPPNESPLTKAPPQSKTYIQPAIPLVSPTRKIKPPKNRAVTDPVTPKPLFSGSRKVSVSQLRKKYSDSKPKANAGNETPEATSQSAPTISKKAGQVLGLQPEEEVKRSTSPPAVPATHAPDTFGISYEAPPADTVAPTRQIQSTPVPTRRYLRENGLPIPAFVETPGVVEHRAGYKVQDECKGPANSQEHMRAAGTLHPPKMGTYARMGGVGVVEGHGMHRVDSVAGIIENAAPCNGSEKLPYASTGGISFQPNGLQVPDTGELLPSIVYTPSIYSGVWENDPAVGYSLPPFSPMPKGTAPTPETHSRNQYQSLASDTLGDNYGSPSHAHPPPASISLNELGSNPSSNRLPKYQHSFTSANSWASESRGDSLTTTNPPLSALLPPRWPHHDSMNSVPSPPQNQYDFQRSGSVPAALAQIELTVHHHLDTAFMSLSRLITDKHDRMVDQTIRRLEDLEDATSKGLRAINGEVQGMKKDVGNLRGDLKDAISGNDGAKELIKGLEDKLQALDKHIEEHARNYEHSPREQSASEPDFDRHPRASSHRRAESANGAFGQEEQRQKYGSGVSHSSNSARQSGTSSRCHRSNTISSQICNAVSDERSARREYFAELGAARGAVPDIRNHPAYAGISQGQGIDNGQIAVTATPNGPSLRNPSLGVGEWYQRAYGQHR
ncbi:hypothetical protein N7G274_001045 [Stereocaulon virgatum]|uniref:Uncharacterized protein n=1 Tax=Stereocaulon virgatum TaxID=373712 RepID=A0ABR4AQH6_9LECA